MNKTISLSHAFSHCASTGSYWLWIGICFLLVAGSFIFISVNKKLEQKAKYAFVIIPVILLFISIFLRPVEVAANTTEDQAARGVYIGY